MASSTALVCTPCLCFLDSSTKAPRRERSTRPGLVSGKFGIWKDNTAHRYGGGYSITDMASGLSYGRVSGLNEARTKAAALARLLGDRDASEIGKDTKLGKRAKFIMKHGTDWS